MLYFVLFLQILFQDVIDILVSRKFKTIGIFSISELVTFNVLKYWTLRMRMCSLFLF